MALTGDGAEPLDASKVATLAELAAALRQLRRREARLREGRELTYHQIAARTGWSATVIGAYLNGTVLPPTDRFDALAALLGAGVHELGPLAVARDRVADARRRGQPSAEAVSPGWTPPRELPAPPAPFVGREAELARLDAIASDRRDSNKNNKIGVVSGMAGVGKSALALRWAHRRAAWFPDGQLHIDLRGFSGGEPVDPADALARFLRSLGLDPAQLPPDQADRARRYRRLLEGRRVLVLLDNARDADQVRPLLPDSPQCTVLVTSRNRLTDLTGADGVGLDVLSSVDATALLRQLIGERVDAGADAAAALADSCGGLPLALRIAAEVAARRAALPLRDLVEDLSDVRSSLDVLDTGEPRTAVRSVLSWSEQSLSPEAARLFRLLGLAPGPHLTLPAIASLGGLPAETASRHIATLLGAHLLSEPTPGRYLLHDVLRAYAAELVEADVDPGDRHAARLRLLDHCLHSALLADHRLEPGRLRLDVAPPAPGVLVTPASSVDEGLRWFAVERPALVAAVRLAAEHGHQTHAWQLAWAMGTYLDRAGHWRELADTAAACLAADLPVAAAGRTHNLAARAALRLGLADTALDHLWQSLEHFVRIGDELAQATAHSALGKAFSESGAARAALHHHDRALTLFRRQGKRGGEAASLNNIGFNQARLGEYDRALLACEEALALARLLGERKGEAHCLDSLAYIRRGLGEHEQAIEDYHAAIRLFDDVGARRAEADSWTSLGDAYAELGHHEDAAADAWRFALEILERLDDAGAADLRERLALGAPPPRARR